MGCPLLVGENGRLFLNKSRVILKGLNWRRLCVWSHTPVQRAGMAGKKSVLFSPSTPTSCALQEESYNGREKTATPAAPALNAEGTDPRRRCGGHIKVTLSSQSALWPSQAPRTETICKRVGPIPRSRKLTEVLLLCKLVSLKQNLAGRMELR